MFVGAVWQGYGRMIAERQGLEETWRSSGLTPTKAGSLQQVAQEGVQVGLDFFRETDSTATLGSLCQCCHPHSYGIFPHICMEIPVFGLY